ncbi:prepilin-type cleavage/methylation-like protein [Caballeronia temeraria]|uniref:Prepilin-type cleavage/methylation-like protein n=1 Tax=Caballeronia temeraria TaxID=1777137 RepID=A0A158C4G0_9BURK|nr:PilW family protein [Caballeronia temeraria]SAK77161.1 prepilin-type cleavage/methylation-like protein [Caballeronia temeraria]
MTSRLFPSRGHTLLEMTIALALGMLIVIASLALYRGQRDAFERAADAARIHDAASIALDVLGQHIQMAGFASSRDSNVDASVFGCAQGRVVGADSAASCESLASHSDGVQIRYAVDVVSTWPSSAGVPTDCLGQTVSDAFVTNRFYAKASSSTGEPELYCEGSGAKQAQPIVEGIERMRVMYWLAGASSAADASAVARERWRDAYAVDICIVVRGFLAHAKRKTSYVDCSGSPVFVEDGRVRQVFWRRVAIRNSPAMASGGAQ